jgi:hypothetical protein
MTDLTIILQGVIYNEKLTYQIIENTTYYNTSNTETNF